MDKVQYIDAIIDSFPQDIRDAHDLSSYHRQAVEASKVCGCFYCLSTFAPTDIVEWIDKKETAICPKCGIDSVLCDNTSDVSEGFLKKMKSYWFDVIPPKGDA